MLRFYAIREEVTFQFKNLLDLILKFKASILTIWGISSFFSSMSFIPCNSNSIKKYFTWIHHEKMQEILMSSSNNAMYQIQ